MTEPTNRWRADVTRRALLRGALGASAAIPLGGLLAACGGDEDGTAGNSGSSAPTPTTENQVEPTVTGESPEPTTSGASEIRVITHTFGETTVPVRPERVVSIIGGAGVDALLTFGVVPVGSTHSANVESALPSWYNDVEFPVSANPGDIAMLGTANEPSLEAITAAEPEVIVGWDYQVDRNGMYDQISLIAPTIGCGPGNTPTWKDSFRMVADAIGRIKEYDEWERSYQQRLDELRAEFGDPAQYSIAFIHIGEPNTIRTYGPNSQPGSILLEAGFKMPAIAENIGDGISDIVSPERIGDLDADAIFIMTRLDQPAQLEEFMTQYGANPLWENLKAVTTDRVYPIDISASTNGGPTSNRDLLLPALFAPFQDEGGADTNPGWSPPDYAEAGQLLEIIERTDGRVLVKDQYGREVDVPADPQRVIADYDPVADMLLSLGIKPIAIFTFSNPDFSAVLAPLLDGVENLPATGGPNYEAVLALEPDLIIDALTRDRNVYDLLSQITTTLSIGEIGISQWRTALRDLGMVLGRSKEADRALAEYEQKVAGARARLSEAGVYNETVACVRAREKEYRLYGVGAEQFDGGFYPTNLTAAIYDDLQLAPPQMVRDIPRSDFTVNISLEVLPELDVDHLFIRREHEESFQDLMNSPLLQSVPAVQKGNVYIHTDDEWTTGGPILNSAWLDIVVNDLLGEG